MKKVAGGGGITMKRELPRVKNPCSETDVPDYVCDECRGVGGNKLLRKKENCRMTTNMETRGANFVLYTYLGRIRKEYRGGKSWLARPSEIAKLGEQ